MRWYFVCLLMLLVVVPAFAGQTAFMQLAPDLNGLGGGIFAVPAPPAYGNRDVEIPQLAGWPKTVSSHATFGDTCGLVMADIDGDDELEIVVATAGQKLYAWDYDGTEIFAANLSGLAQTVPAVGDVTGDDALEIVVTTRCLTGGTPTPKVHVFDNNGNLLHSAAMDHIGDLTQPPTLADLNGDGKAEIIVGESDYPTGYLYVLSGDLNAYNKSWPQTLDHVPATSAGVADIDDDGQLEIVVCSFYSLYAFERDGTAMSGFPVTFADETYSYGSPALADLDGDGKLEILTVTHGGYNRVHAIQYDGTELTGWPFDLGDAWSFSSPAVGDIDGNGDLEVVAGRAGGTIADTNLFVINHDGSNFDPFPYSMEGGAEGNFVIVDLDGDGCQEILFTNNIQYEGNGHVFAVDCDGQLLDGWPLRPAGFTYLNGVTIGDVDGDNVPEIGVMAVVDGTASINLYSYSGYSYITDGGLHWRTYQADNRHTGRYHPVYPDDDDDTTVDDDNDDVTDDDIGDDDDDNDDNDASDDDTGDDDTIDDDDDNDDTDSDDDDDDNDGCGC